MYICTGNNASEAKLKTPKNAILISCAVASQYERDIHFSDAIDRRSNGNVPEKSSHAGIITAPGQCRNSFEGKSSLPPPIHFQVLSRIF